MAVKKTNDTFLNPLGSKVDFMKAVRGLDVPFAAIAGFAAGKIIYDKLNKSDAVSGLLGTDLKGYIIPSVVSIGGMAATQYTENKFVQMGLVGVSGYGINQLIKKATGKTILDNLKGITGDDDDPELMALDPVTQALPAADIDIEREIQQSVSGAEDFSMSDEPVGSTVNDFSMSDEPIGNNMDEPLTAGRIKNIDPDSMDYDIFSGDMMES